MIELFKLMLVCFTLAMVVLPVVFIVALSMPKNSEFRHLFLRVGYAGFALLTVVYFGSPIDLVPDVLFPVGLVDDAAALGMGFLAARKAFTPMQRKPGVN